MNWLQRSHFDLIVSKRYNPGWNSTDGTQVQRAFYIGKYSTIFWLKWYGKLKKSFERFKSFDLEWLRSSENKMNGFLNGFKCYYGKKWVGNFVLLLGSCNNFDWVIDCWLFVCLFLCITHALWYLFFSPFSLLLLSYFFPIICYSLIKWITSIRLLSIHKHFKLEIVMTANTHLNSQQQQKFEWNHSENIWVYWITFKLNCPCVWFLLYSVYILKSNA